MGWRFLLGMRLLLVARVVRMVGGEWGLWCCWVWGGVTNEVLDSEVGIGDDAVV